MKHPKRIMRDGRVTTRRAHDVIPVDCNNSAHNHCFVAVTSWAGQPIPHQDKNWHVYQTKSGAWCVAGPLAGLESVQFETGLIRRAINKIEKENGS